MQTERGILAGSARYDDAVGERKVIAMWDSSLNNELYRVTVTLARQPTPPSVRSYATITVGRGEREQGFEVEIGPSGARVTVLTNRIVVVGGAAGGASVITASLSFAG